MRHTGGLETSPPGGDTVDLARDRHVRLHLVGLATLVAAALRLPFIGHQSLWLDEVFTRTIALQPRLGDVWPAVAATESTPPLSSVIDWLLVTASGSGSDALLRLGSVVAGILTVPAAFLAVRPFAGRRVATATAWLCATGPVLVWYAVEARAYAWFVLLGTLSVWLLARVLEQPTARRLVPWVLTAAACAWTHYFAAFLLLSEAAVLLWRLRGRRRDVLLACAGVVVLAAPLVPLVLEQRDGRAGYIEQLPAGVRLQQTVRQFALGPNPPAAWLEAAGLLLLVGGVLAGLGLAARRRHGGIALLAGLAAFVIAVPALLLLLGIDRSFYMRNVLVAWPLVAAVAAYGLVRLHAVPLVLALLVATVATVWVQTDWRFEKPDWRTAAPVIAARAGSEPVVVDPGIEGPAAGRYLGRRPAAGPVATAGLWVAIPPRRTTRRALEPSAARLAPTGFTPAETVQLPHGFVLVHLTAPAPVPVDPPALGADALGAAPGLLVP